MEVGSLVRHYELIGIVIGTKHDNFSQMPKANTINAFNSDKLVGNPACVVPLENWLSDKNHQDTDVAYYHSVSAIITMVYLVQLLNNYSQISFADH